MNLPPITKKLGSVVLVECPFLKPRKKLRNAKGAPATYCEVFSIFQPTYVTDYVIAEMDVEKNTSKQSQNICTVVDS